MEYGLGVTPPLKDGVKLPCVLILVVMEYGLGVSNHKNKENYAEVLILVVMEYGLGDMLVKYDVDQIREVLILVVMEYGLGDLIELVKEFPNFCLNPCCNGIWSRSNSVSYNFKIDNYEVLILVVMEYGLGEMKKKFNYFTLAVLILVVMEYGLGEKWIILTLPMLCLNPCCNGIWSRSQKVIKNYISSSMVLILVVMEYGLGEYIL